MVLDLFKNQYESLIMSSYNNISRENSNSSFLSSNQNDSWLSSFSFNLSSSPSVLSSTSSSNYSAADLSYLSDSSSYVTTATEKVRFIFWICRLSHLIN